MRKKHPGGNATRVLQHYLPLITKVFLFIYSILLEKSEVRAGTVLLLTPREGSTSLRNPEPSAKESEASRSLTLRL